MPTQQNLTSGWALQCIAAGAGSPAAAVTREVPATVPGCVHTDLLAAGLIDDPYLDENEQALGWIGESDWSYSCLLPSTLALLGARPDRVDLVFDGLDTVAEVRLDGVSLLSTRNMHRSYRIDVTDRLTGGPQQLEVRFASPLASAQAESERLGSLPSPYPLPFNAIRKMASNFGWDWGPTLITSGIWKPARLEAWSTARLAQVRPHVSVAPDEVGVDWTGKVVVDVDLERAGADRALIVRAEVAGVRGEVRVPAEVTSAQVELVVPKPARWWPRGHGDQPLHTLVVSVHGTEETERAEPAEELDRWTRRIGFRSVQLDTGPDQHGSAFTFRVNGEPVSVQGANWIPDDCFPTRVGPERYRRRIQQAVDANVNLLRVWGGGIYESDDFYAICDQLGVLTWQDFLFACAAYPEDPGTAAEVEAEARDNVVRLMSHPSLVLWNGNNENIWGHADWGWQEQLGDRPWGMGYYTELLPKLVAELDPTTPYWPGSPWSGTADRHPNDPAHGNMHIWDVWNERDYTAYGEYRPRFVSEFGYQGPPTWSTLTRAVHDDPLRPDSAGLLAHQKADHGQLKLQRGLEAHFGVPDDVEDWHFLTQLNQARAVRFGVEHFRSLWPVCTGSIVWQLNDCWPVTSWAAIDGDGRRKPLWYALRAAYAPRLVSVQPRENGLAVVAVNDTDHPWRPRLTARRVDVDGWLLADQELQFDVSPRGVAERPLDSMPGSVGSVGNESRELLIVDGGLRRAVWTWAEDKDLDLPTAQFSVTARSLDGESQVTVTARTLLRDLCLFPDRLDPTAEVDDLMVTLLPGESHTFTVAGLSAVHDLDQALSTRPVLRCVNDIPSLSHRRAEGTRHDETPVEPA